MSRINQIIKNPRKRNYLMKTELVKKWTTALESGEYEQGIGKLRSPDDKYCCLGVLCDIMEQNGVCAWQNKDGSTAWTFSYFAIAIVIAAAIARPPQTRP